MKKIYFIAFSLSLFAFIACEKDEDKAVLKSNIEAGAISNPSDATSYVLTKDKADNVFQKFSWTAVDYGVNLSITYKLQFDVAGNDFKNAVTVNTTQDLEAEISVGEINDLLLIANIPPYQIANIEFRVVASVNSNFNDIVYSSVAANVTPYFGYPVLYMQGSHNADASSLDYAVFSVKEDGKYEAYQYIPANTDIQFNDPATGKTYGGAMGTLVDGGAKINVATAGYYKINIDMNTKTGEMLATKWAIVGHGTEFGWPPYTAPLKGIDMTYNLEKRVLEATATLLDGEIKFRANNDWSVNFGDDNEDGTLDYGGANLKSKAGTYNITVNLSKAIYTYSIEKKE